MNQESRNKAMPKGQAWFLVPGSQADICVFDQANIASNVTAANPRRYASGIAHVLVNGQMSMRHGKRTTCNAGQVIRDFAA